jgi:hypothetical protein
LLFFGEGLEGGEVVLVEGLGEEGCDGDGDDALHVR